MMHLKALAKIYKVWYKIYRKSNDERKEFQYEKLNKTLKNNEKAITLIALVITIIVLLILAGISISMLSGDNGILQKATQSKEKTERAEIIETAQMDILGKQSENHGIISEDELIEILTSSDYNTKGRLSDNGEESVLQKILTSKDGKYTIAVSEIYSGALATPSSSSIIDYGSKTAKTVAIGDDITIATERFKVIKKSEDNKTITAIPYYNLKLDEIPIKQATAENAGTGIGNAGTIAFSSSNYWNATGINIDMTNETNNVQGYISSYQTTLETLGASNITVKIGKYYGETTDADNINGLSGLNPSGVGRYWIGSSHERYKTNLWTVNEHDFNFLLNSNDENQGVRPVIIISL